MITVEIKDAGVSEALARLQVHLSDLSSVMNEIGMFLVASTEQRFAETVGPDGGKWAPRSPVTIKHYERTKQKFGPVLHKSGELSQSIFHAYDAQSVTVGTNLIQSAVMQFGAAQGAFGAAIGKDKKGRDHFHHIPWGNIPARPFIGISDSDRIGILDTVAEWLASVTPD
jgi:phage gpG-like protein